MLVSIACAARSVAADDAFTSQDGKFSVRFPATPSVDTDVDELPTGKVTVHLFIASVDDSTGYVVQYGDYPTENVSATGRVEASIERTMRSTHGTFLRKPTSCDAGRVVCRDYSFRMTFDGAPAVKTARVYLRGTRMYEVAVLEASTARSKLPAADMRRFFDSFKML